MAGRGSDSKAPEVLSKIRVVARSLILDLCRGKLPSVVLGRYRAYCTDPSGSCHCNGNVFHGEETISFRKESHVQRLHIILRVLGIIQQLLQENRHGTKRDIYYMHPSLFSEQKVVDRAIKDICILLQCSRHDLNVTANGLDLVSVAQYILIVEKETVFYRLANDKFCEKNRCIVITGKGYPDVSTRRFLKHLVESLHLPVYCLVDCDPYGLDILMTYTFGSTQMAFDSSLMSVPDVHWLGVHPSDRKQYSLPDQCFLPLSTEDRIKAEAMLQRCYLRKKAPAWRLELEKMLLDGIKCEIEALSAASFSFLSEEYIPGKIQSGTHI